MTLNMASLDFAALAKILSLLRQGLGVSGMASRPGDGHLIQSYPPREYGWGTPREVPRVCSSWPLRQPVPHQRIRPRAGPVSSELHQQSR
jgi:hypothetical protein